ncbi:hypothetical protein HCH_04195 [Hahella chejuensis KCTC 2396]|uniref:Uncharacterized protein n=1 Tax=Hahella chejuensis (strain KCTC 2396) TaxID=349521 RepID=Q2SEM2_HAHCH|nr:hypothetical protein HCH_04195 [Hahella chejuensis KCTC 2396]
MYLVTMGGRIDASATLRLSTLSWRQLERMEYQLFHPGPRIYEESYAH